MTVIIRPLPFLGLVAILWFGFYTVLFFFNMVKKWIVETNSDNWGLEEEDEEQRRRSTDIEMLGGEIDDHFLALQAARATRIHAMSLEEKVALYGKAFDQNENQRVLDEETSWADVLATIQSRQTKEEPEETKTEETTETETKQAESEEDETSGDEEKGHPETTTSEGDEDTLPGRSIPSSPDDEEPTIAVPKSLSQLLREEKQTACTIVHRRVSETGTIVETTGDEAAPSSSSNSSNGNCVICFEDFRAGDTVVWSETNSCPHVYHKDCLVSFFAHRDHSTTNPFELDQNPCPTCRQPFVTICRPVPEEPPPMTPEEELEARRRASLQWNLLGFLPSLELEEEASMTSRELAFRRDANGRLRRDSNNSGNRRDANGRYAPRLPPAVVNDESPDWIWTTRSPDWIWRSRQHATQPQ